MTDSTLQMQVLSAQVKDIQIQLAVLLTRVDRAERQLGIAPPPPSFSPVAPDAHVLEPHVNAPVAPSMPRSPSAQTPILQPSAGQAAAPSRPAVPVSQPRPAQPLASPAEPVGAGQADLPQRPTIPTPGFPPRPVRPATPVIDWETLIGGKWAMWVGSLSLFLALACFLAYTWKSLSADVRVGIGLACGLGLMGAAAVLRPRTQRWFTEGLTGAGLAVVYLSIWAGAQFYGNITPGIAYAGMVLTTVVGVSLAVRYDAESLSLLAVSGGFLTPFLLHMRQGVVGDTSSQTTLLAYIAVLDAGILAVSLFKQWRAVTWLSFAATIILCGAWAQDSYRPGDWWTTFTFESVYFLLFVAVACAYSLLHRKPATQPDLMLLLATTLVYAVAGSALLHNHLGVWPGSFLLGLALLFAFVAAVTYRLAPGNRNLHQSAAGLALFFLTLTIPVQWQHQWLPIGWSIEAALLLILGVRLQAPLLLLAGRIVWLLALVMVMVEVAAPATAIHLVFVNPRALPLLVSLLANVAVAAYLHYERRLAAGSGARFSDEMAPLYSGYATTAGACLLAQEIYRYCSWNREAGAAGWEAGAGFIIACALSLYALATFAVGLRFRDMAVRVMALAVMAVAMVLPVWIGLAASTADWTPFLSLRGGTFLLVAVVALLMGKLEARYPGEAESGTLGSWAWAFAGLLLAGASIEVYFSFAHWRTPSPTTWVAAAFYAISMLWSAFALLLGRYSRSSQSPSLLVLAQAVGLAGGTILVITAIVSAGLDWVPWSNWRMAAFGFSAATAVLVSGWLGNAKADEDKGVPSSVVAELLAAALLFWGVSQELLATTHLYRHELGERWALVGWLSISMYWFIGALTLLIRGVVTRQSSIRAAAYLAGTLALGGLLMVSVMARDPNWTPFANWRWGAFGVGLASIAMAAVVLGRYRNMLEEDERQLPAVLGLVAVLLALWGLTEEVHEACYFYREALGPNWQRAAQMALSILWSIFGTGLLIVGIRISYPALRHLALLMLGITVFKVFLLDLSFLTGGLRILSLAGLGCALIFISWLYARLKSRPLEVVHDNPDHDENTGYA